MTHAKRLFLLTLMVSLISLHTYAQTDSMKMAAPATTTTTTTMTTTTANNNDMAFAPNKTYKGWSITGRVGLMTAFTNIKTLDFKWVKANGKNELKPGFGLGLTRMFSSVFGLQANFLYGKLLGISDKDSTYTQYKNSYSKLGFREPVYFKTNILHGSLNLYINLSNLAMNLNKANQKAKSERKFGLYSTLGMGVVRFNSEIHSLANDTLYAHSYRNSSVGGYLRGTTGDVNEIDFPLGLGFKYKLSRAFDLGIENTVHVLITDKLDAYVLDRNSPFKKNTDKYMFTNLALTYKFVGKDPNTDYVEWMDPTETMYDEFADMKDKVRKLSTDSDNDGVSDMFDKEPNTPAGTKVDGSGVSMDLDYDGIPDAKDADLFSPKGAQVDADGRPIDTDNDGVPDILDKEPNTKAGSYVNFQGKTLPIDSTGGAGKGIGDNHAFYFDYNSSAIKPSFYPLLADLAKKLKANNLSITLTGNADERGSNKYNQTLGLKRANAIKKYLVKNYAIDEGRITTQSKGEDTPLSKKLYSANRRVDVDLKK